mgnify:CR=1 FL=1
MVVKKIMEEEKDINSLPVVSKKLSNILKNITRADLFQNLVEI